MRFSFKKPKENTIHLTRLLGYGMLRGSNVAENELSVARPSSGAYPRFHLYLKEEGELLHFNLHLDQKKASYSGQTRHSGEYDNDLIMAEKQRIETVLKKLNY